jgi:oxysterol-binding protein 1
MEKQRLETKQRAARKAADRGDPLHPRWFAPVSGAVQGESQTFRYKGGYWEERAAGQYTACRDIFSNGETPSMHNGASDGSVSKGLPH